MKTINLKHSLASGGTLSPASARLAPGQHPSGLIVLAVTGLPDHAGWRDAARILDSMMIPGWLYEVDASQAGMNLYRSDNLTKRQLAASPTWFQLTRGPSIDLDPVAPGFEPSWDSRNDTPPHRM